MRQRPPSRRRVPRGRATRDEGSYSYWHLLTETDFAKEYGSVEAAAQRYRDLRERGEIGFEPALERPDVWWATEPGVPDDLRRSWWPHGVTPCGIGLLPQGDQDRIRQLAKGRREWLRASGRATREEIRLADLYADLKVTP